jgi:hypothetical protein
MATGESTGDATSGDEAAAPARPRRIDPTAHFVDPRKEKPQRYSSGRGQQMPTRPLDPIRPYMPPRVNRRRRSDWPILVFALVVACLVMAAFCVAGFALYTDVNSR